MNLEKGLIMISYTDYIHTEYWNKKQNNQNELKNAIVRLVKQTFTITVKPPKKICMLLETWVRIGIRGLIAKKYQHL